MTTRLTVAQAVIAFLKQQYSERDGQQHRLFEGCLGIFGHGNVAGIGQALEQDPGLPYYLFRNEQAMVHTAAAFAKTSNRLRTLACTTSIGPGATNMVTGAAVATVNRLPVLLLPGDIFARRNVAPVLQQLESPATQDISVNDCFKPVSRYWDRIERPEQILTSLPAAVRVLTSPAETGAVVLALPQDVQAEAFDYPAEFFEKRIWAIARPRCDRQLLTQAAQWIRAARQAADRRRRRCALFGSESGTGGIRFANGNPSYRNAGGKRVSSLRSPASARCDGRDRNAWSQRSGPRGRSHHRNRHALLRFHNRFADCVSESRGEIHQRERQRSSTPENKRHCRWRETPKSRSRNSRAHSKTCGSRPLIRPESRRCAKTWEKEVDRIYNLNWGPCL